MSTLSGGNGDFVPETAGPGSNQPPNQPQNQPPAPDRQPLPGSSPPTPTPTPASQPPHAQAQPRDPGQPAPHQPSPDYQASPPAPPPPHTQPPYSHPHGDQPPARVAVTVPLGKMLYVCVAALGVINLFLGYVGSGAGDSMNLYKAAVAIYALAPTMLFLAGLVAVRECLPRERPPGALPAMITTAVFVPLVLSAISSDGAGDLQTLFLVFGAVQFVLAWLAYLFDSGVFAARR